MKPIGRAAAAVLAALTVLSGCSGPDATTATHLVRDSAGVRIVESSAPAWAPGEGWRIAAEPEVVIGAVDGDERYLLDRVWGVRRFDDGRIAVLDVGSSRVRVYDEDGRHLFDAGGPGEGPAEFDSPQFIDVVGDTIVVFQSAPVRLSWFDGEGTFLRNLTLPSPSESRPLFGRAFGRFADGSMPVAVVYPGAPSEQPGRARERESVWRLTTDPPAMDSLIPLSMQEVIVHASRGWNDVVFGRTTLYAAGEERVYTLETGDYSIRAYDTDGTLREIFRRPFAARVVTADDKRRWAEQLVDAQEIDAERIPMLVAMLDEPDRAADRMPSAQIMVVDRVGHVWVEDFDDVGIEVGAFSVFDPDGSWLGRVDFPSGLPWLRGRRGVALDIDDETVLGVWTDDLGIEQVRVYRIDKEGARPDVR